MTSAAGRSTDAVGNRPTPRYDLQTRKDRHVDVSTAPLRAALARLETNLSLAQSIDAQTNDDLKLALATAAIKSFEYTYEVATKLIHRHLETTAADATEVDRLSYPSLLQLAVDKHLISDTQRWLAYRRDRNVTSHAYHAALAFGICSRLPGFARDAHALLATIEGALHAS